MKKVITIRETNMHDGIDLFHTFSTVEEAEESGRFDFIFDDELGTDDFGDYIDEDIRLFQDIIANDNLEEYIKYVCTRYSFFSIHRVSTINN